MNNVDDVYDLIRKLTDSFEYESRAVHQFDKPEGAINYPHCFGGLSGYMMGLLVGLNLSDEQMETFKGMVEHRVKNLNVGRG